MWGAITRLFHKNENDEENIVATPILSTTLLSPTSIEQQETPSTTTTTTKTLAVTTTTTTRTPCPTLTEELSIKPLQNDTLNIMDKFPSQDKDSNEVKQARQKACVKWILSKAFNNHVPENLRDPFYRDNEGQEHLKPQIVVGLGNATLYCQTLSNLYSDPNYQSLNHWSILQTLTRKGTPVVESPEMPLTETVLIQTNPLRINAHMSVIEALMILYAKEIASGDRVSSAIGRISGGTLTKEHQHHELSLIHWIAHACAALKKRINQEIETGAATDENGVRLQSPDIPPIRDYHDLCDGVCLAFLIAYYCPKVVPWTSVRVNYLPTVEDSIHNVLLLSNFSQKQLPYTVFHMTPEDITYMRGSMKQNLVVLLADLFNLFEIHPAKCVCYPGMEQNIVNRSSSATIIRKPTPPRDQFGGVAEHIGGAGSSTAAAGGGGGSGNDGFVVHRGRTIPTLASMQEPLVPARIRQAKEKTNMDSKADERGDNIAAGRPSNWEDTRRPSYAGRRSRRNSYSEDSQLTIENFGGSQDQLHMIGRQPSTIAAEREPQRKPHNELIVEPAVAIRSSLADARGTLQLGYETDSGSEKQDRDTEKTALRRQSSMDNVSLRNVIHSKEKDNTDGDGTTNSGTTSATHKQLTNKSFDDSQMDIPKRKTSFVTPVPNTTTWQQQSVNLQQLENDVEDDRPTNVDVTKLSTIRMKLEEKRRHIEQEKRKFEIALSRQQQQVGKAAFLQAINKNLSDINSIDTKWENQIDTKKTPELEHMDIDQYQQSIAAMNSNLQDIQQDIHRLANQQNQIQAQHMQAQQLMQAQQIANMLNQQQQQPQHPTPPPSAYGGVGGGGVGTVNIGGSQHHIPQGSFNRSLQQQQSSNFGSSPHLTQQFINASQQGTNNTYNMRPPSRDSIQYINDQGQYISQTHSRECSPFMNENVQYGSGGGGGGVVGSNQYPPYDQQLHYSPQQYSDDYRIPLQQQQQQQQPPQSQQHSNQFYLHDIQQQMTPPQAPTRRTWAQTSNNNQSSPIALDLQSWAQQQPSLQQQQQPQQPQHLSGNKIDSRTWKSSPQQQQQQQSFMLHTNGSGGGGVMPGGMNNGSHTSLYSMGIIPDTSQQQQSNRIQRQQISQLLGDNKLMTSNNNNLQNNNDNKFNMNNNNLDIRMPMSPSIDDMAPQSISFIGDDDDSVDPNVNNNNNNNHRQPQQQHLHHQQQQQQQQHQQYHPNYSDDINNLDLGKLNITSGKLTYRIPSPTRPALNLNSFQDPNQYHQQQQQQFQMQYQQQQQQQQQQQEDDLNLDQKGFYIAFDNEPKRPKPPLRTKRSPKKERGNSIDNGTTATDNVDNGKLFNQSTMDNQQQLKRNNSKYQYDNDDDQQQQQQNQHEQDHQDQQYNNNNNNNNRRYETQTINRRHFNNDSQMASILDRRHLDDNNSLHNVVPNYNSNSNNNSNIYDKNQRLSENALIIDTELTQLDPESVDEMEKKKEKIMLLSLQRRQQQEEAKAQKEIQAMQRREKEQEKEEERVRKRDEQAKRRAAILEHHKLKKAIEEAEQKGMTIDKADLLLFKQSLSSLNNTGGGGHGHGHGHGGGGGGSGGGTTPIAKLRQQKAMRPRPKTIHIESGSVDLSEASSLSNKNKKGSNTNLTDTDSGLGRATPPRRAPSPGMGSGPSGRHLPSPSGPGSLPGFMNKRRNYDDGSSDISSTPSSMMDYSGPKLYKQPAMKSNRGIILNAVEYCVFPGVVNRDAKQKVLEKIARSEAKHFLILFRDAGCQFRALYSYWPENETVLKLYGTGPTQVDEFMFDKFFKYNSGGKCFSQIHTKHLTVTIDAFTIHNSLWQGKKVNLPSKKDMALVI